METRISPKRNTFNTVVIVVLLCVTILSLAVSVYLFFKMKEPVAKAENPNKQLIEDVSKIILLPTSEDPVIATIDDLEKVKDQPFFKNAQNGDKVLAYVQLKKAYLYRPSIKQIIEVGPIVITTTEDSKK